MDLGNKTLEEWLTAPPLDTFHESKEVDYFSLYNSLKAFLEEKVHPFVGVGETLKDPDILLNDHGPNHVATVISRASKLVSGNNCKLTAYEIFLLLCCIQLHDTGNVLGRYKHEENIEEIMTEAKNLCGRDVIEKNLIYEIASSHSGKLKNGDKDKINYLKSIESGYDGSIYNPQLLASILRFADELADDKNRADTVRLKKGLLPKGSEIFHAYASCLYNVITTSTEITLDYKIDIEYLTKKMGKKVDGKIFEVYLIDEIYERIIKMHNELVYCMRFSRGIIDVSKIVVKIEFYSDKLNKTTPKPIRIEICERGYPNCNLSIYDITDGELFDNDKKMNGEYFHAKYNI